MRISWAAATDAGLRRPANEDAFGATPEIGLFVVADGMGGHAAGEVASRLAVTEIARGVAETAGSGAAAARRLEQAFVRANEGLAAAVRAEGHLRGMATTASAVLVDAGDAVVAHVGDSRVYRLRRGRLVQLTRDHSWVQEEVDAGRLSAVEAQHSVWRHVVTRALTGGDEPGVDVTTFRVEAGDRVLLCSDGLTAVVAEHRIQEIVATGERLEGVCQALIDAANELGGPDNITALVLQIDAP